jgi:hypothetical protein
MREMGKCEKNENASIQNQNWKLKEDIALFFFT